MNVGLSLLRRGRSRRRCRRPEVVVEEEVTGGGV
jgi:hypothetical protein